LLRNPAQMALIIENPQLIRPAVDELLRFLTVLQGGLARVATADVNIGGQLIRKGEGVIAVLAAGNHDEEVFPGAGQVDIRRNAASHVAFGYGAHQCIGRALALAELEIGLGELIRRLPGLRLAVDYSELTFLDDSLTYGVRELPVAW
jgi:cytochrome P450